MKTNAFLQTMLEIEYATPRALEAAKMFNEGALHQVQFDREFIVFLSQRIEAQRINEYKIAA